MRSASRNDSTLSIRIYMSAFRLKMKTDSTWVKHIVEGNIEDILTDHAYCEQKAASSAISFIVLYPEHEELVAGMAELAQEEMNHFSMVHRLIVDRGFTLGRERKDSYVNELLKFIRIKGRGKEETLCDRLLFAAMIEARSCERFKVMSENIEDKELADFYYELMVSEARHYTMFITFARQYCPNIDVDKRWHEFLEYEGEVITRYGKSTEIHG